MLAERPHHEFLLGCDLAHYHRCFKEIRGPIGSPLARLGPLGWTAFGPLRVEESSESLPVDVQFCEVEDSLERQVQKMWELDVLGVEDNLKDVRRLTNDECRAEEMLKDNLKFNGERYIAPILWSEGSPSLADNYDAVLGRTHNMESRLKKNSTVWSKVEEVMEDYKDKGYVSEVNKEELRNGPFFLPYFPLIKDNRETTKCRIVFDCSARYDGQSLNDKILIGPKLQNDIIDVLQRFSKIELDCIDSPCDTVVLSELLALNFTVAFET